MPVQADNIEILVTEEEIKEIVERIASEIARDFAGEELILVGVLDGAFVFLHDLARAL